MAVRKYRIEELDCANCAAKLEDKIRRIPQVRSVTVNFFTQQLVLEVADEEFDQVLQQVRKIIRRLEPGCVIVEQ